MVRTQILLEPEQHHTLTEIARQENRSLSDLIRELVDERIAESKAQALAAAAQQLLDDYREDAELTALTALDGEDFHA
jgi:predicted DNA-binding ribbon-helix-helix protein